MLLLLFQASACPKANGERARLAYLLALIMQEIITLQEFAMLRAFVKLSASYAGLIQFRSASLDLVFASIT